MKTESKHFEHLNVSVGIGRGEDGKLWVDIDTSDLSDEDTVGKYAVPKMRVYVNDAIVSED